MKNGIYQDAGSLFEEMIKQQKERLLCCANHINPYVTAEDIMQPNDFPELENHPYFRYEEGVLEGLQSAYAAWMAYTRENR
ncbi:MAG: hypothetical protein HY860_01900 [Chlamydiales bacterium]|nr:hypothetical protein [Chlamydiales bacterium]